MTFSGGFLCSAINCVMALADTWKRRRSANTALSGVMMYISSR